MLLNSIADRKAEKNFHFILAVLRQQSIKKLFGEHLRKEQREESLKDNKKVSLRAVKLKMNATNPMIDLSSADQKEDNLITYREFMQALKGARDHLYYRILPKTLSFSKVLESTPVECEFSVSDLHLDDFYMFRYELHTINKKNCFVDEKRNEVQMFGSHPLLTCDGVPVKDLLRDLKKGEGHKKEQERDEITRKCHDIYVPPGIVRSYETSFRKQSTLASDIKNAVPADNIYRRRKLEQRQSVSSKQYSMNKYQTFKSASRIPDRDIHTAPFDQTRAN